MEVRNTNGYLAPALTVDAVLLRGTQVLLVKRGGEPFRGKWALPGGFVEVGERTEDACRRELVEETGLRGDIVDLLDVYSDPTRDPRGHTISIVYVLRVGGIVAVAAGDDAEEARWFDLADARGLAFDHDIIIDAARRWLAVPANAEKLVDNDVGMCA